MSFSDREKSIFEKYPKLFRRAYLPMQETCMCWGLEIPDEWIDDVEALCEEINAINPDAIEFEQIKVKWGSIVIYYDFVNECHPEESTKINRLIEEVEKKLYDKKYVY